MFEKYKWQIKDDEVVITYFKVHQGRSEENHENSIGCASYTADTLIPYLQN
jgi:hypothetical protein